ncbi:tetratricopeptide repeat protein [Riemerella columbina]|uniref:tetratricopeptide repeat protein n=1 Tax=Riemerella columbina TaxID=103810 RepID=UPI000381FC75|nr:tetratricopeptide repeat protein [Riemerella columbina]
MRKKVVLGVAVAALSLNFVNAQTVEEGLQNMDAHKYAKAKEVFNQLIQKDPSSENYFYMGNIYLTQYEPNFDKAKEYFDKGLAKDRRAYLDKIGLATIKLGKGNKAAINEIKEIVEDSRGKDAEVLFRAGEALTMFENHNAPDLAIDYINQAIERAGKKGKVPANYYYSLGDAYRLKKDAGNAMNAYDNAAMVARNKASVFTRMATLWMAANQWKLAVENLNKSLAVDKTYAPAYKALANYNIRYQKHDEAAINLLNYLKYADEDPVTLLEVSKLYFANGNYKESEEVLAKVFDKVDDPIKYKLRAYLLYSEHKYDEAKKNLDQFISQVDASRVQPADQGLLGLIYAGQAYQSEDATTKDNLKRMSQEKIALAKAAKDQTMQWDVELAKINSGGGDLKAAAESGPTSPEVNALKAQVAADPKNSDNIYKLAMAYQDVKNWNGAAYAWQQMINLLPNWAPAYYSQGYAYQQAGNNDLAKMAYQSFIDTLDKQSAEERAKNQETLAYAYFAVAYLEKDSNVAKAKDYVSKSLQLKPDYKDAQNLSQSLNK